ncbi:hypothetical protein chiPu_0026084, partial [Chiloscyllium punctatum]|nr:hypothetical protein [Chiloscyllium punctatum]
TVSLRLENGGSPCAGRVEIHYKGQWGTVYDLPWDMQDAAVVCRELDCGTAVSAPHGTHFGRGSGPIVIEYVQCSGTERALRDCRSVKWDHDSISHDYDAGVVCSGKKNCCTFCGILPNAGAVKTEKHVITVQYI